MRFPWRAASHRVNSAYRSVAVTLFGTLLLFVLVNLGALAVLTSRTGNGAGQREQTIDLFIRRHGIETLRAVYPGLSDDKIRDLLIATGDNVPRYEPYVDFVESAFISPEMVVRPEGYRIVGRDQAPWPPPKDGKTVFVFGSSVTLGTGALSDQTIPAYLQKILRANFREPVNVYNFGTESHYSTQEVLYLFGWLRKGIRPDLAIFIDGVTETVFQQDRSAQSWLLKRAFEQKVAGTDETSDSGFWDRLTAAARALPVVRLAAQRRGETEAGDIRTKGAKLRSPESVADLQRPASDAETRAAQAVLDRYQATMTAATGMASASGVETFFVWQPAPLFDYDLRFYPFELQAAHLLHRVSYPLMAERVASGAMPRNFGWCATVQEGIAETLYVDQMHYRPRLSQLTARCAVDRMMASGLFDRLGWTRTSDHVVVPDFSREDEVASSTGTLVDLDKVLLEQPGRLHASNVHVTAPKPGSAGDADPGLELRPVGPETEHYLTVFTELAGSGEYVLGMTLDPRGAKHFRVQAWNSEAQPSGVVADLRFDDEAVQATPLNAATVSVAQLIRRGGRFEFTLQMKLPGGLSRVVLQPVADDGRTAFAPPDQSVLVRGFAVNRPSS